MKSRPTNFWNVTPCSRVYSYVLCGATYLLLHQRRNVSSEDGDTVFFRSVGEVPEYTASDPAVRTSNITWRELLLEFLFRGSRNLRGHRNSTSNLERKSLIPLFTMLVTCRPNATNS
jgi:hypothetical protein